jgi:hypothetical protein
MSLTEEFEDTKEVIRIRITKTIRQHNDQKDKQRSTKNTHKAKDRVTRTTLQNIASSTQYKGQAKKDKEQIMIYKRLYKMEQHEPQKQTGFNSGSLEG